MSDTKTEFAVRLAAILDLDKKHPSSPEDNPLADHTVEQIAFGAGVAKSSDLFPAASVAPHTTAGYEMEVARNQALRDGKKDKSAKRMAQARNRARRKLEFDDIYKSEVRASDERLNEAWYVVFPLVPIVSRVARDKQQWANRLLGANVDDIAQMALEQMAVVLAKSERDLGLLRRAAEAIGEQSKATGKVPGDQRETPDKDLRKARKWLMGMVNNRVLGALVDSHMSPENVRWDNLDLIATVMANINGPGGDPIANRFKADRAPAFLGTKFQRPGGIDSGLMATAINAAISDRGLDRMVEVLIDADNRRSNGSMAWSRNAEAVFLATPRQVASGEALWDAVVKATKHLSRPTRARADAARTHARNCFAWLPDFIMALVESFDYHPIGYSAEGHRKVMASDFELFYLPDLDGPREPLVPKLTYASVEEAAAALNDTLSNLLSGEDLVKELVNA